MSLKEKILNLLYPKHYTCLFCHAEIDEALDICDTCQKTLPYIKGKVCLRCGQVVHDESEYCDNCKRSTDPWKFDLCRSVFVYTYPITKMIRSIKYDNAKYMFDTFGKLLTQLYLDHELTCDIIIPIPLHEERRKQRGYNQAEWLAMDLATSQNIPMDTEHLIRSTNTPSQTSTITTRKDNVAGAFTVTIPNIYRNKTILLVDDVITSGATIQECAKVLKDIGGAKQVLALTLAHSPVRDTSLPIK